MEWMEGHCCQCGNAIPIEEQRLTNGHLFCEFCSHPKFREPTSGIVEIKQPDSEKTPAFLPENWPEVTPPTFETHDPLPHRLSAPIEYNHSISERPTCTCDGIMREPEPDWPGCCARCLGVIDRSEAMLYDRQVRKSTLQNGVTLDKASKGPIHRLLMALKSTTGLK